jgi:hypothetical protein
METQRAGGFVTARIVRDEPPSIRRDEQRVAPRSRLDATEDFILQ